MAEFLGVSDPSAHQWRPGPYVDRLARPISYGKAFKVLVGSKLKKTLGPIFVQCQKKGPLPKKIEYSSDFLLLRTSSVPNYCFSFSRCRFCYAPRHNTYQDA